MSSVTTDLAAIPSATVILGPLLSVPAFDELRQMTAVPD
jgi:hypothetical protein